MGERLLSGSRKVRGIARWHFSIDRKNHWHDRPDHASEFIFVCHELRLYETVIFAFN